MKAHERAPKRLSPVRLTGLAALIAFGLMGFRCTNEGTEAPRPKTPRPELRLLVLTDPRGYLEPCGCQQRPLGGVDKLASLIAAEKKDGVPTLLLAAGNLTFGLELKPEDAEAAKAQEAWRAETLVDVWSTLGFAAVTPGPLDFSQQIVPLTELVKRSRFAWVNDNVSQNDPALSEISRAKVLTVGAHKIGVLGLLAPPATQPLPSTLAVDVDLAGIAKRESERLRKAGAEFVIALLSGDRRAAREVAVPGVDVIVLGGVDQEAPLAPVQQRSALMLHAGREGQHLLVADVRLKGEGALRDVSAWTQEDARKRLEAQRKDLAARIQAWEKDPKVDPQELASQKTRLAQMESELKTKQPTSFEGRWLSARILELAPEVRGDPSIAAKVDSYDKRVNEHNRTALAHLKPKPAAEGEPVYVGSKACQSCHQPAYTWWKSTKHGHAYKTLEDVHKEFSLACASCHLTGYNQPGGSTITHTDKLKDVGCESCHGPGSQHVAGPAPGQLTRNTPENVCAGCHNQEHSARFAYDAFRSLLIVPGHGLPLPSDAAKKP
jgi:predicted CXXCH cytochrome family protein